MSFAQRLKALDIWMTWKMARPRDRDPFKMPVDAKTGGAGSSMDAHTWTTYDRAAAALEEHLDVWNGLAFALRHNVWVVDLDGCRPDGEIEPWALSIIKRLNSYTELSPSGHGVHVIMTGDDSHMTGMKLVLDETRRVEMYKSGHYFTFTEKHVAGTPTDLEDRTAAFEALRAEVEARRTSSASARPARRAPEKPATDAKVPAGADSLTDAELLDLARSGPAGEAFRRLYDDGDMRDYNEDHSAADMGLCGRLAFWTGKDPERMDRLFRESALMRPKWDTRRGLGTYGEQTVQVAIDNAGDIYEGKGTDSTAWLEKQRARRAAKVAKTQKVGPTVEAGKVRSDIGRGADKTAFASNKVDDKTVTAKQVAQDAARELFNATPDDIELMKANPETKALIDDLRARLVSAGTDTDSGSSGRAALPEQPATGVPALLSADADSSEIGDDRLSPIAERSAHKVEPINDQASLIDFNLHVLLNGDISTLTPSGDNAMVYTDLTKASGATGDHPKESATLPESVPAASVSVNESSKAYETATLAQTDDTESGKLTGPVNMPVSVHGTSDTQDVAQETTSEPWKMPAIQGTKRPLPDVTRDALDALAGSNHPPRIFQRGRLLMRVAEDEKHRPSTETLMQDHLRGEMARAANFFNQTEKGDIVPIDPPIGMVKDALTIADYGGRFPSLDGIIEAPVLRPDGSVQWQFGYDPATLLYYHPSGLVMQPVPEEPTHADLAFALDTIEDLIGEFPFDSQASHANAYAMMLTPIVRPHVRGQAPLGLLDAPQQGTGKTLFATVNSIVATGQEAAAFTAPTEESEWRKSITSMVRAGYGYILIDNLDITDFRGNSMPLRSSSLSAVLTTGWHRDRILGVSEPITLLTKATWFASGNNITVSGDLIRRVYRTRLDAGVSRPWQRTGFKHASLIEFAKINRAKILWALLVLARAWVVEGSPKAPTPVLGSFEPWSRAIGGILHHAGVEGFLGELDKLYEEADSDTPEWEAFLTIWREKFGPQWLTAAQLTTEIVNDRDGSLRGVIPGTLADYGSTGFPKKLGNQLFAKKGMRMGKAQLYIVTIMDKHSKIRKYRVLMKDDAQAGQDETE